MQGLKKNILDLNFLLLDETDKDLVFGQKQVDGSEYIIHVERTGRFHLYVRESQNEDLRMDPHSRMGNYYFPRSLQDLKDLMRLKGWS